MTCGFSDFDFLIGQWKVHHRQLRRCLSHCESWQEFLGWSDARKILGGFGVMDENILFEPRGTYRSMFLRTFNTEANCWSIWWYDGRTPNRLDPPVIGKFGDGIGVFLGNGTAEATSALVRYVWTRHVIVPRCEQAISMNNGLTWKTHWTMEFHRGS